MQEAASTREELDISDIFEKFKIIKLCEHEPEIEIKYNHHNLFKFQMCHNCWNSEKHYTINKDSIQVIRPNQLDVAYADCLQCESDIKSCNCYT